MPIARSDFYGDAAICPAVRSAAYDPERPFLFEDLAPKYATRIVRSTFIPMRDGVRLSTDFHIPLNAALPLPVVLVRTPYGKRKTHGGMSNLLPEQGFVFAVQDVRGRYESEGEFIACGAADRNDGYDTVTWLAAQSWCSGAIGTMGSSYTGETAAKLAAMRHSNHRCGIIMFDGSYAGGNSQNGAYLQGGVTLLRMLFGWFRDWVPKYSFGPPAQLDREAWFGSGYGEAYSTQPIAQPAVDVEKHLRTLPVHSLLDRAKAAPSEFDDMLRRSSNPADPYWEAQGFLTDADRFHSPTLHVTGPLERGGSSFDNFRLFAANAVNEAARDHQYLLFSPAPHSQYYHCSAATQSGARDLGDTRFPYYHRFLDWFAYWLRGENRRIETWPPVRYFLLNRNSWQQATAWPPESVSCQYYYLHSDGNANSSAGEGLLLTRRAGAPSSRDTYTYDPDNPTPSEPEGTALDLLGAGYADRSAIEMRRDVLIYTSEPLVQALTVVGPVSVDLYISSNCADTDFAAVLTDVNPEGKSINLTHGIARARYRDGLSKPTLLEAGKIYRIAIDLWHVAVEFPAGSRIRLAISSSHFPAFDRNLNTGGNNYLDTNWSIAENSVYHDFEHPSALMLPICRSKAPD